LPGLTPLQQAQLYLAQAFAVARADGLAAFKTFVTIAVEHVASEASRLPVEGER
jgi:hypothetical protein